MGGNSAAPTVLVDATEDWTLEFVDISESVGDVWVTSVTDLGGWSVLFSDASCVK
jgi:hypothetical protein